jgi:hypothetical protein
MIDPTKDPYQIGKVIPLDVVLARTVDLIQYCEDERKALGLPEIGYEVGTEETNGGLTSTEKYREFIERLKVELGARGLPMPTFIVGQTGTLTRLTEQVGHYDFDNAVSLAKMATSYGVGLKEHNCDYLDDVTMLIHAPAGVTASNVAPQFGTDETRALLRLAELEGKLAEKGLKSNSVAQRSIKARGIFHNSAYKIRGIGDRIAKLNAAKQFSKQYRGKKDRGELR